MFNQKIMIMKTAVKIKGLMLVAVALLATANVNAQGSLNPDNYDQGFKLGFGVSGGGVLDKPYDFSLGADVRLQYDFSQRTSITLTTGFTNMFVGSGVPDLGFIPIKGGFKAFVWGDRFYVLGEAGVALPVTNDYNKTVDSSLLLSPGIGYATKYVDLSLRYEHYTDFPTENGNGTGQVALRLAYGFRL